MRPTFLTTVFAAILYTVSPVVGDVMVVNDTFADGAVSNGADALDVAWTGQDLAVNFSVVGGRMQITSNSNNRTFNGSFSSTPLTLSAAGDFARLTLEYQYNPAETVSTSSTIQFGLINTSGASTDGYYLQFNPTGAGTARIVELNDGITTNLGGTIAHVDTDSDGFFTLSLEILRTDDGSLDLTLAGDLVTTAAIRSSTTTPATYTFDAIYGRLGGTGNQGPILIDDVLVVTNVPEPATLGLIGAGLLCFARRRRA